MVYSASAIVAKQNNGDSLYYLKRELLWLIIGMGIFAFMSVFDYHRLFRLSRPLFYLSIALLVFVLLPGIGSEVSGAKRWLKIGGFRAFQPVEFMKVCLILYLSVLILKKREHIGEFFRGFAALLVVLLAVSVLLLLQPNLGYTIVIGSSVIILSFLAGVKPSHIGAVILCSLPPLVFLIFAEEYRMRRVLAFMNPWADPSDKGYHLIQSFIALGSGGLFGLGFGNSKQKLFYLPEPHTDFIFSIIGEEGGFMATLIVIVLFIAVLSKGFKIALASRDDFGYLVASGITVMLGVQTLINIGVVIGMLPPTGIPLPFISYGGSSMLGTMTCMGILMNISSFSRGRIRK